MLADDCCLCWTQSFRSCNQFEHSTIDHGWSIRVIEDRCWEPKDDLPRATDTFNPSLKICCNLASRASRNHDINLLKVLRRPNQGIEIENILSIVALTWGHSKLQVWEACKELRCRVTDELIGQNSNCFLKRCGTNNLLCSSRHLHIDWREIDWARKIASRQWRRVSYSQLPCERRAHRSYRASDSNLILASLLKFARVYMERSWCWIECHDRILEILRVTRNIVNIERGTFRLKGERSKAQSGWRSPNEHRLRRDYFSGIHNARCASDSDTYGDYRCWQWILVEGCSTCNRDLEAAHILDWDGVYTQRYAVCIKGNEIRQGPTSSLELCWIS